MKRRRALQVTGAIVALGAAGFFVRACFGLFVNKEDEPVALSLIEALEKYKAAIKSFLRRQESSDPSGA